MSKRAPKKFKQWRSDGDFLQAVCDAIYAVCNERKTRKTTNRHVFYRVASINVVPKTDHSVDAEWIVHGKPVRPGYGTPSGSDLVERMMKDMRKGDRQPVLPWEWVTDTTRSRTSTGGGTLDMADRIAYTDGYSLDHWPDQPVYVEVWTGKSSIEQVIEEATSRRDVGITSTRGFSSLSLLREAALDVRREAAGRKVVILWVDDCDPSARVGLEHLIRDLRSHCLEVFSEENCQFIKVAVTDDMLAKKRVRYKGKTYRLQTRPTKIDDNPHYNEELDSADSIEVDALPVPVLNGLIADKIEEVIDQDAWAATDEHEVVEGAAWRQSIEVQRQWLIDEGWIPTSEDDDDDQD
jgi:hypothetical protein